MSLSAEKVAVTKVIDHRIHFPKWSMPVREGGNSVSYLRATASSTGNSVQFDIVPPSPGSAVLGRDMLWYNKIVFVVSNPGPAPDPASPIAVAGDNIAPRAFPVTSCVDSMTIQVNNETITTASWSEIGHVLRRFNPRSALYKLTNFCPWFPDQSAEYASVRGTLRDVLSAGASGDVDFLRGAYARFTVQAGATPLQATCVLETLEPVNMSPFMYGSQAPGIPYVQTFGLRFNLSKFERLVSQAPSARVLPITAVQVNSHTSQLYYQSISIPALETIPRVVALPHFRLLTNTTPALTLPSNIPPLGTTPNGTTFTSQVINYPCVPSRIYVFCAPPLANRGATTTDFTAQYCGGLSVQWNSRTALMTSAQPEQLYSQAVDAGLAVPWEQWAGTYRFSSAGGGAPVVVGSTGSVLCIRPGTDYDLEPGLAPGMAGSHQFQVQANFNNQSGAERPFSLYVVAVLPGTITLTSGFETSVEIGVISQEDFLNATERISESKAMDTYGSGWFDNLKSMVSSGVSKVISDPVGSIKGAIELGKQGYDLYNKAQPYVQQGMKLIGRGATSGGSDFYGGGARSGGSALAGGAMLTKRDLASRLR